MAWPQFTAQAVTGHTSPLVCVFKLAGAQCRAVVMRDDKRDYILDGTLPLAVIGAVEW